MTGTDPSLRHLIGRWRDDPGASYRTWFLWEERLKNFRSIRRGIARVVEEIEAGTFGNVYKGSSLETVVGSIAEQRQIFNGADHAFLWKPKLRIPDIYESPRPFSPGPLFRGGALALLAALAFDVIAPLIQPSVVASVPTAALLHVGAAIASLEPFGDRAAVRLPCAKSHWRA